jgi:hypothetical protein
MISFGLRPEEEGRGQVQRGTVLHIDRDSACNQSQICPMNITQVEGRHLRLRASINAPTITTNACFSDTECKETIFECEGHHNFVRDESIWESAREEFRLH